MAEEAYGIDRGRPEGHVPNDRLPCGSLREHEWHVWTGQTTGMDYSCAGHPARKEIEVGLGN